MNKIHFFRPGKHIANNGTEIVITAEQLKKSAEIYNAKLHEAPITIGHPVDNAPAYGWISGLEFNEDDGNIYAVPSNVNSDFEGMVKNRSFPKVSASWYMPDAPTNPSPGNYYLRHLAFLGAAPPAIKGLKEIQFSDTETGIIDFGGIGLVDDFVYVTTDIALFLDDFRDWILETSGAELADKLVPKWKIQNMRAAAPRMQANIDALIDAEVQRRVPNSMVDFSEDSNSMTANANTKPDVTDIAAQQKAIADQQAAIDKQRADMKAERERQDKEYVEFKEQQRAKTRAALKGQVDELVKSGRVLAAKGPQLLAVLESFPDNATLEFGEGDSAKKVSPKDWILDFIKEQPVQVEFQELTNPAVDDWDSVTNPLSNKNKVTDIAKKARAMVTEAEKAGESLSFSEAVNRVIKG